MNCTSVIASKVEYALTSLGETRVQPLKMLCEWSEIHLDDVRAAREHFRDENTE